jgi:poly-beta-1,6-N-acetyl-D-glucosamine biosynthesis protein PgaD
MAEKLIINARRQLGWPRRILSDLATLALWMLWLYLWLPAFRKLEQVMHLRLSFEPAAVEVLETVDPISPRHSLEALVGTCALLLLWSMLPRRKVTHVHDETRLEEYAEASGVPVERLVRVQRSRVATVHHDDLGRIIAIDINA